MTTALDAPARRLMVVDDEESVRARVRAILEPEGWTVTEASGGTQALTILLQPPMPDVVLVDLMIPGLDGFGVLSELRESRGISKLPIVILSTGGSLSARLAETHGADACLTKPVDPTALRTTCDRVAAAVRDGGRGWGAARRAQPSAP